LQKQKKQLKTVLQSQKPNFEKYYITEKQDAQIFWQILSKQWKIAFLTEASKTNNMLFFP